MDLKASLIIPMYNESKIVDTALNAFYTCMRDNFSDFEILFVDDGSTDDCGEKVESFSALHPEIRLVRYENNKGKGCAVRTGVLESTGDTVVFTDCDIAYGTDTVVEFFRQLEANRDISLLVGSRNLSKDGYEGYTFIRKAASKIYIMLLNIMTGFNLSDSQCGMKGFCGNDARKVFALCDTNGFAFDIEVIMIAKKLNMKISEYPVRIVNHRESKVNVVKDALRMIRDVCRIKKSVKAKFAK